MKPGLPGTLLSSLEERLSASAAKSALAEALHQAGLAEVPEELAAAQEFVRGPLAAALSNRVGPVLAEHWTPALLGAIARSIAKPGPAPAAESDPWLGRTLVGRYRLVQRVAKGQRGTLYRAERVLDGGRAAVKLVRPLPHQSRERFDAWFIRECEIAKSLAHRHTVAVHDHGIADDRLRFVAMEWLSGSDLSQMLASRGPLSVRQATFLARQVCDSLAHAHSKGIVHGDLSPSGIFVARQPSTHTLIKVLDYGRQRAASFSDEGSSQVGLPRGWARYLAPEQISNDEFDARVDVYALGAILYEALCGQRPFSDATGIEILLSQAADRGALLRTRLTGAQTPSDVEDVVMQCLAQDPADRFQTAAALGARLAKFA